MLFIFVGCVFAISARTKRLTDLVLLLSCFCHVFRDKLGSFSSPILPVWSGQRPSCGYLSSPTTTISLTCSRRFGSSFVHGVVMRKRPWTISLLGMIHVLFLEHCNNLYRPTKTLQRVLDYVCPPSRFHRPQHSVYNTIPGHYIADVI